MTDIQCVKYNLFRRIIGFLLAIALAGSMGCSESPNSRVAESPEIHLADSVLLDTVQRQTFKYFWDFAHPASGMIRERASLKNPDKDADVVTTGGTGFGIMAIIVAMERGYISRSEGLDRIMRILRFLDEKTQRYHGAWPHWLNGQTGATIPFSPDDDGGDLVETAFLIQGLLTARQYFSGGAEKEIQLRDLINDMWQKVEWDWYTKGENVLYWHWSPNTGWKMNHKIQGWNEALIVYVLAASSENHGIDSGVYHNGWARDGVMKNGRKFMDIMLPLGEDYGGPLFFAHYSFLGLDPRNLRDRYADYWEQNVNHSLINYRYCVQNQKGYTGYHEGSWGLTSSYSITGYAAHSPTNDLGVISPTAAISSIPYTPSESLKAIRWMYEKQGKNLWKKYGFIDAYSLEGNWFADGYLAIDQGPQIIMIENYRTSLLWELFMSCPEVQKGLERLGFEYE